MLACRTKEGSTRRSIQAMSARTELLETLRPMCRNTLRPYQYTCTQHRQRMRIQEQGNCSVQHQPFSNGQQACNAEVTSQRMLSQRQSVPALTLLQTPSPTQHREASHSAVPYGHLLEASPSRLFCRSTKDRQLRAPASDVKRTLFSPRFLVPHHVHIYVLLRWRSSTDTSR